MFLYSYSFFNIDKGIKVSRIQSLQLFFNFLKKSRYLLSLEKIMAKNEYEVQGIIGKRRKKNTNKYQYHVVWKGYSKEEATWEPEANLSNVSDLVEEFNRKIEKNKMMSSNPNFSDSNKMEVEKMNSISKQKIPPKQQPQLKKAEKRPALRKSLEEDDNFEETKSAVYQVPPQLPTKKPIPNKFKLKEKDELPVKKEIAKNIQPPQNLKKTVPQKQNQLNNLNNNINNMNGMINGGETVGPQFESQNEQLALQIVGMFLNEYGKISYAVYDHEHNTKVLKDRKELIAEEPKALIRFYQKNMNLSVL